MNLPTPYWTSKDGRHVIYCADCLTVLPHLSGVDAVVTDPPYASQTHDGALTNRATGVQKLVDFDCITDDKLREVYATIRVSRWVISFMDYAHVVSLEKQPPTGLRSVRFGIWVKDNPMPQLSGDRPAQGFEAISILHKDGGRMKWNGGGLPAVWYAPIVSNGSHPTSKPLKIVSELVRLFSDDSNTILDPFMGSGTTGVACIRTGRRFIGVEIEPKYCAIAVERMERELSQPMLPTLEPEKLKQEALL
jgi:site-specific DNA-methyltransferase (adenine-specific)